MIRKVRKPYKEINWDEYVFTINSFTFTHSCTLHGIDTHPNEEIQREGENSKLNQRESKGKWKEKKNKKKGANLYLLNGLYRIAVTYLDWNLWVKPRAITDWVAAHPFSIKRWFSITCWGLDDGASSELCIPRTVNCSWDGTIIGSFEKSSSSGNEWL